MIDISSNTLGSIAVSKVICDLTEKGYSIFSPVTGDFLPFDLIACKGNDTFKIQVKHSSDGMIRNRSVTCNTKGFKEKTYSKGDFDYYAVYLPSVDSVIYPSINFGGCRIRTETVGCCASFYYYKDFLQFTDKAKKRNYKDFNIDPSELAFLQNRPANNKIDWPDNLANLVWEKPLTQLAKDLGVSDTAVRKRCKRMNIDLPKQGYWSKK